MADFAAVLRKTIAALKESTPEARERIYQKARSTIEAKLKAVSPPPPAHLIERQLRLLEDAIETVEAEFTPAPEVPEPEPESEPENEFDRVLRDLEELSKAPSSARWAVADKVPQSPAVVATASPAQVADETLPEEEDTSPTLEVEDTASAVAHEEAAIVEETEDAPEPADIEPQTSDDDIEPSEFEQTAATADEAFDRLVAGPHEASSSTEPEEIVTTAEAEPAQDEFAEESTQQPEEKSSPADTLPLDEPFDDRPALQALRTRKAAENKSRKWPVIAAAVFLLFGVGAVGAWVYRDDVVRLAGFSDDAANVAEGRSAQSDTEVAAFPGEEGETVRSSSAGGEDDAGDPQAPVSKLTQRLLPDGSEVDEGPGSGESTIGEGTSVAASTEGPAENADRADNQSPDDAVAVGQKAIFYEERTIQEQASASDGSVVWTVSQESPGADQPPEPVIHAEATIPDKRLRLKLSIRRNVDQSLPASYIAELIFLTPEDFSGGAVGSVASVSLKRTEQDAGNRLLGVPAKIADGFFLVALSDNKADVEANNLLLDRMEWIDIPIVYTSGRRALITLEKGILGGNVFNQALTAWREASSG